MYLTSRWGLNELPNWHFCYTFHKFVAIKVLNINNFTLKQRWKQPWWPHSDVIQVIFPNCSTPIISSKPHVVCMFSPWNWCFGWDFMVICFIWRRIWNDRFVVCLYFGGCWSCPAIPSPPVARKKREGRPKEKLFWGNKYRGSSSFRTSSSTNWRLLCPPLGQVTQLWAQKALKFW